jgi:hypothetical protein
VLLLLVGCAHTVSLTSDPVGAFVTVDGARVGVTPYDVVVRKRGTVTVEMVGYRPISFPVGPRTHRFVDLRLIPEHGGAGTWEPSEAR